jgi:hypothetical protein
MIYAVNFIDTKRRRKVRYIVQSLEDAIGTVQEQAEFHPDYEFVSITPYNEAE